jgi:hypothetical protein
LRREGGADHAFVREFADCCERIDVWNRRRHAPDVAVATGDLAFEEHTGGHVVTPAEWNDFLTYAEGYLNAK